MSQDSSDDTVKLPNVEHILRKQEGAAKNDPAECCGSCYFGRITKEDVRAASCHAEPPKLFLVPQGPGRAQFTSVFPPIDRREWCGKWAPKKASS